MTAFTTVLSPDYTTILHFPREIDLKLLSTASHHRLPSPSERVSPTELRMAVRLHSQPHQLLATWGHSACRVDVEIWGLHHQEAAKRLRDRLGLSDDTANEFQPTDAPIAGWWQKSPGLRLTKNPSVLDTLVPIILAQRITGKEAKNIHHRLFRHAAEPAPGPPGLHVPPSPNALREIGYEAWHQMGLERKRARLIHRCAEMAQQLESWRSLDTEPLYDHLVAIPGIGPWTANRLLYALGHSDAVWIGDYNLPSFVAWNLADEARADDARMLELLEPHRGHRARVLRLMELHGSSPPRFGPRLALRNIQRQ